MRRAMMILVRAMSVAVAVLLSDAACAEVYPARSVKVIVPFAPAGPADVLARLLTQKLSASFGQQFYVENQAGAGGNLGMGAAARATPYGQHARARPDELRCQSKPLPQDTLRPVQGFCPGDAGCGLAQRAGGASFDPGSHVAELIRFIRTSPASSVLHRRVSHHSASLGRLLSDKPATRHRARTISTARVPPLLQPLPATPQLRSRCSRPPCRRCVREIARLGDHHGGALPGIAGCANIGRSRTARIRRPIQCSAFLRPPVRPPAPFVSAVSRGRQCRAPIRCKGAAR